MSTQFPARGEYRLRPVLQNEHDPRCWLRQTTSTRSSHDKDRSKSLSSKRVVGIQCASNNAKNEDFDDSKLLSGDIVDQMSSADGLELNSPFAGGKSGLQRELRRLFNSGETLVIIKVKRRAGKVAAIRANIALDDTSVLKKQYVLKAPNDPSHVVIFTDTTEDECLALQEMKCARMVSLLSNTQISGTNVRYSWEDKTKRSQHLGSSNVVFSMLVIPDAPEYHGAPQYKDLDHTVNRATTWLSESQASGVPINFLSLQTEPILRKVSGEQASRAVFSSSGSDDLSNIVNTGMYGFEDYHGIDVGVVRAVRIWYVPNFTEVPINLKIEDNESRLGLGISRTPEGFCYVSSVDEGTPADRAGLKTHLAAAISTGKLLVVTRIGDEKVTPWLVSSNGGIHCYDTSSIGRKLSVHLHSGRTAVIHIMAFKTIDSEIPSKEQ